MTDNRLLATICDCPRWKRQFHSLPIEQRKKFIEMLKQNGFGNWDKLIRKIRRNNNA